MDRGLPGSGLPVSLSRVRARPGKIVRIYAGQDGFDPGIPKAVPFPSTGLCGRPCTRPGSRPRRDPGIPNARGTVPQGHTVRRHTRRYHYGFRPVGNSGSQRSMPNPGWNRPVPDAGTAPVWWRECPSRRVPVRSGATRRSAADLDLDGRGRISPAADRRKPIDRCAGCSTPGRCYSAERLASNAGNGGRIHDGSPTNGRPRGARPGRAGTVMAGCGRTDAGTVPGWPECRIRRRVMRRDMTQNRFPSRLCRFTEAFTDVPNGTFSGEWGKAADTVIDSPLTITMTDTG